jgi:hypothetical protein
MIHVPADVNVALYQESVTHFLKVTWTLNDGQEIDLSDRILTVGNVTRSLSPYLLGYRISSLSISFRNDDRFFSVNANTTDGESMISYRGGQEYMASRLQLWDGVVGPKTGVHYLPVYKGMVQTMDFEPGVVSFHVVDALSYLTHKPLPEQVTVDPSVTVAAQLQDLLKDFSVIVAADIDTTASFDFAAEVQEDLDWTVFGIIPQNTLLWKAANDLARSGFGVIYPDEEGLIKYQTEFPVTSGQETYFIPVHPLEVSDATGSGFSTNISEQLVSTEVTVRYQNVEVTHRDTTLESKIGRVNIPVSMPFILFARCARQAARVLQETGKTYQDVVSFALPSYGLTLQLNDRVSVTDPISDFTDTYRVISKTWTTSGLGIGCVKERHIDTYIDETFGEWDVTSWTDASTKWW